MNSAPLISIVTACFNSEKTIRTTIESVLNQTYPHFEYIIKDGGSKDGTLAIAEEYREAFGGRLRIISQPDSCMYEAMNQGIEASKGEIVGIINSDDYYSPDTLERVAAAYEKADSTLLVVIGDMERVTESGEFVCRYHFTQDMVDRKECFGHPSMFAARAVYDKLGLYDTSYHLAADGDWQYRAMEDDRVVVQLCPEVFNHMREGGASDRMKYRWKWFQERSRMRLEHHRGPAIKIYASEFYKVLKADVKNILPKKAIQSIYRKLNSKGDQPA